MNYMHMQTIKRGHHIYHLIYCNYQILLNAIGRPSLALLVNSPPIFHANNCVEAFLLDFET